MICNDKVQWFEAEKLTAIGGSLVMRSAALTSVTTPSLATIGGDFELQGSNEDKAGGDMTIVEMKALGSVGGKITVKNLAKLNAVKFEALTSAGAVLLPDDSLRIRDDFAARTFRGRRRHSVHRQYRRYGNRRYDDEYGSQADRHEQSDPGGRNGLPHGICRTSHSPRSERSYGEGYRTGQSG